MLAIKSYGLLICLVAVLFYQIVRSDFKTVYLYDSSKNIPETLYPNETFKDFSRLNLFIPVGNVENCIHNLHGWWYIPHSNKPASIVVMAHGLGG